MCSNVVSKLLFSFFYSYNCLHKAKILTSSWLAAQNTTYIIWNARVLCCRMWCLSWSSLIRSKHPPPVLWARYCHEQGSFWGVVSRSACENIFRHNVTRCLYWQVCCHPYCVLHQSFRRFSVLFLSDQLQYYPTSTIRYSNLSLSSCSFLGQKFVFITSPLSRNILMYYMYKSSTNGQDIYKSSTNGQDMYKCSTSLQDMLKSSAIGQTCKSLPQVVRTYTSLSANDLALYKSVTNGQRL